MFRRFFPHARSVLLFRHLQNIACLFLRETASDAVRVGRLSNLALGLGQASQLRAQIGVTLRYSRGGCEFRGWAGASRGRYCGGAGIAGDVGCTWKGFTALHAQLAFGELELVRF